MVVEKISIDELFQFLRQNDFSYEKFVEFMSYKFNLVMRNGICDENDFDEASSKMLLEGIRKKASPYDLNTALRIYIYHHWMLINYKTFKNPEILSLRSKISYHTGETIESVGIQT
jgi:hypothetical protein